MADELTLTDATLDSVLNGAKPVLLLLSNGEGLRSDFSVQLKKAISENPGIVFARLDPAKNPEAKARFGIGEKPVMIAWLNGNEIGRRIRPWGVDVIGAVDSLKTAAAAAAPVEEPKTDETQANPKETTIMQDKPLSVSDATFQADVIDYSDDLPVVIDFWAEWCGPCRMVAPILDKLAKEFAGKVRIAKVNVDENPALSQTFNIMSIPTIMMVKQKTIVFSQPGALPEPALRDLFNQLVALEIPAQSENNPQN